MRIKVILQNYNTTHTKYQELLSAMLKEQRGERMDEEFIRNRITELRLKKGVSEYQMSMELGPVSYTHLDVYKRQALAFMALSFVLSHF